MTKYLNKPFPAFERKKHKIIASLLFSLFVFVFLLIFQPFGLDNIPFYKPIYISGFFFITLIALLIRYFIVPAIFPRYHDADNWTVRKNLVSIFYVIIIIAILNWIYNFWMGEEIAEQYNLFSFLFITISVGFFPTILLVILMEKHLSKKHNKIAQSITSKIQFEEKSNKGIIINLLSENKNEEIQIELNQLICIKSESNYAFVYFLENDKISKQLIRNSLTKLMQQLIIFDSIKRCHRSYIVNFSHLIKVSGNARNYNLHIRNLDFSVPVSRNFPKSILDKHSN
jgi:hypothetical protein